jgi:hypothetical protein
MHRVVWALCLSILVHGCAISPAAMHSDTMALGDVIEDTTNKLLVSNVLRARDNAPLHFADLPVLRESLQQSFSLSWLNFFGASRAPSSTRDSVSFGTSVQKTPSFDLNQLHSKDFITGISSPIDPKIVKYWLDRGLDRRIVMLLFFSAVEIVETSSEAGPVNTIRITNSPREAAQIIGGRRPALDGSDALRCDTQSDFERYLKLINTLKTFFANAYRERKLITKGLQLAGDKDSYTVRAIGALDLTKVQVVHDEQRGTYSLYSLSSDPKVAFCFYDNAGVAARSSAQYEFIEAGAEALGDKRSCHQSVVDVRTEDTAKRTTSPSAIFFPGVAAVKTPSRYCDIYNRFTGTGPALPTKPGGYPRLELKLYIRSVGEIFQFLGDLLHYQDELKRHLQADSLSGVKLNTPVTFGYCGDKPERGCDDIFLRLDGDPCNARFSLTYREREYHVGNFDPAIDISRHSLHCHPDPSPRRDHTLEILSVLHQLVGLNKSATDVRSTPSVQVLP